MNGTITKYRKTDGRISWGYYYKIEGRQYTKSGFQTKFDASKALGAALAKHEDCGASTQKRDSRTLAEYFRYWLDYHAALRCEPKTLERYRQLAEYVIRLIGEISILDLKPGIIQEAVNALLLRGGARTEAHPHGRPLAAKTVHSTASLLFTCLGDAARLEHIPANPMADRRVKLPKRPKPNPAIMDAGAIGTIFQAAHDTRLYSFVVTAACSGCRRGELLALTWADLDFGRFCRAGSGKAAARRDGNNKRLFQSIAISAYNRFLLHSCVMARKKNPAAVELGRKGGKKKVPKGLATMTPEQRKDIQSAGGKARWKKTPD